MAQLAGAARCRRKLLRLRAALQARPNWSTYSALLELAAIVKRDLRELEPRDMIDVQSFLWVQGSDEYA